MMCESEDNEAKQKEYEQAYQVILRWVITPTAKRCIPIEGQELECNKIKADDTMYRIITVSTDPIEPVEMIEVEPGVGKVDFPTEDSMSAIDVNSLSGHINIYEMPLWDLARHLVPWIMRPGGSERIIKIMRLGVFKNPERYGLQNVEYIDDLNEDEDT